MDVTRLSAALLSDWGAEQWERSGKEVVEAVLAKPLREVLDEERTIAMLDAVLARPSWDHLLLPIAEAIDGLVHAGALGDEGTLGDHVPPDAREILMRLASRPDLLREETVQAILSHEALESVMQEVLFETLSGFWSKANPFGEGGIVASTLGRFVPIGLGRALEAIRADFEKRLEPEMRRFLKGASRAALRRMGSFVVERQGDPASIAMRREMVALFLAQPVSQVAASTPGEVRADVRSVVLLTLRHSSTTERAKKVRELFVRAAFARYASEPVGKLLEGLGVKEIDPTPLLRASWPIVRTALGSEPAKRWLGELLARA